MTTECEKIDMQKYGGIVYVAETAGLDISAVPADGILTAGRIVFTDDPDLIDTRIDQVSARHLRPPQVVIRGKL